MMEEHRKHTRSLDKFCFCGKPSAIDRSTKLERDRYHGLCDEHLKASLEILDEINYQNYGESS